MRKSDELSNLQSCLNRALDDEFVFVLLGRDPVASEVIDFWVARRLALGLNEARDAHILNARVLSQLMDEERPDLRARLHEGDQSS